MIKRMAYQVYERNFDEKELVIAGINGNGSKIAELIDNELKSISKIKTTFIEIQFDKSNPGENDIKLSKKVELTGKSILIVDDVLNTARTFAYALLPFAGIRTNKIQSLVLVDRNHRSFPITADFVGMELSTTLQEHIEVSLKGGKVNVYLS